MRKLLFVFVLSLVGFVGKSAGDERPNSHDIARIKQCWKEKQDSIATLQFSWNEVRTQPKGYFDAAISNKRNKESVPPIDLKLSGYVEMRLDFDRLYSKMVRDRWSVKQSKVMETEQQGLFKNGISTTLTTKSAVVDHPDAEINTSAKPRNASEMSFWPVGLYARGISSTFSPINLDDYELSGKIEKIDGGSYVELVFKGGSNTEKKIILLDPTNSYSLKKYKQFKNGRMIVQLDVKYSSDQDGKRPLSWNYTVSGLDGNLIDSMQVNCDQWLPNEKLNDSSFELKFPVGTSVYDETSQEVKRYVVQADGEQSPSVSDKLNMSYDSMMAMPRQNRFGTVTLYVVISFAVVALLVGFYWWRMRSA